jgi:hypothetical protein
MTRKEFTLGTTSIVRHLLTGVAGALAAHGLAGGNELLTAGASVAVFVSTLGWSFVEKNKLLAALCANLPVSEIETLAKSVAAFKASGANPLLIANIASTVMALANQELLGAYPELAPPPPPVSPPPVAPVAESPAPAPETLSPPVVEAQEPVAAPGEAAPADGGAQPLPGPAL